MSFEQVLKAAKARYILGLTATPLRKDGHHPIILMQCGPIRARVESKKAAAQRPFTHTVIFRNTTVVPPAEFTEPTIQDIYDMLIHDEARNKMIIEDITSAVSTDRFPLVLTERTEHLTMISELIQLRVQHVIVLKGGMGKRQRATVMDQLKSVSDGERCVVLATGRYAGEGFDDPRFDTLFLMLPISWRGTLQQYVGRLHRTHTDKREVIVYDYVDERIPMLRRMYRRRLSGYRAMGYLIKEKTPDKGESTGGDEGPAS
jgi:superfamily II DNA or RNA helicase